MTDKDFRTIIREELESNSSIVLSAYCTEALNSKRFDSAMGFARAYYALTGATMLVTRVFEAEIKWHENCITDLKTKIDLM